MPIRPVDRHEPKMSRSMILKAEDTSLSRHGLPPWIFRQGLGLRPDHRLPRFSTSVFLAHRRTFWLGPPAYRHLINSCCRDQKTAHVAPVPTSADSARARSTGLGRQGREAIQWP